MDYEDMLEEIVTNDEIAVLFTRSRKQFQAYLMHDVGWPEGWCESGWAVGVGETAYDALTDLREQMIRLGSLKGEI